MPQEYLGDVYLGADCVPVPEIPLSDSQSPFTPSDRADADRLHNRSDRARARAADAGALPRQSHPCRARARTLGAHDAEQDPAVRD